MSDSSPQPDDAWLVETPAPDDAGAQTQAAFHFQHECTARVCVPMLVRRGVVAVVCEEHEDFVVFYETGRPELVSVKHRDGASGPWTFAGLCIDGGVGHLFARWLATAKRARCRLMTNGSLKTGNAQARRFAEACLSRDNDEIEPWVEKFAKNLKASEGEVRQFLRVLTIEAQLPGRAHLSSVNISELVMPACRELKIDVSLARGCYERIVAAVARANRDGVGEPIDLLAIVQDPATLDASAVRDSRLRRRRLNRELVGDLLFPPVVEPVQLTLGAPDPDTPAATRLRQKLEAGGLGPTAVESAIELRARWYSFESSRRNDLPGGDPFFEELRLRVRGLVALSESRVSDPEAQYGPKMHLDVQASVKTDQLTLAPRFPLDDQLLQGLIFQLTDECKVWWSERFEVTPP